jgi:hypothetical protein
MAVGSVLMWLGLPAGLVFLASRVADSPNPSMGPYLLILIGLPVGLCLLAFGIWFFAFAGSSLPGA